MSIRYRPLACSTKRRNGAASSSPRPRPVSLRTISNQSHSFVFLEESLGAHTRSVDAPASLGGGSYASASNDGEVGGGGGGGSGSGGVGGVVGSAGVGALYEQSQILRYLNAAGDGSMGITGEQLDSLTHSLANGGSYGGRGGGGGGAGDSDEGDGSDDLMSSAGALSSLGSDGNGGGGDDDDEVAAANNNGTRDGGGGGGGEESDEDRAPSPIIIWRSTARVKLAEDVPLELLRELEAEADQLNETGVGGGNWTTAHEQSGPATSGTSGTPGSPGRGRGGAGGWGGASGAMGNGGSVGGSAGRRRAGPPPSAFPHRKKRNTPGGLTPGRTLRVAHSPVRTSTRSTTEYQGPPLPASSFTYKPYRPKAKPAYGNAWYLRPDEWSSHSASPRTHGNAGNGGAGGGQRGVGSAGGGAGAGGGHQDGGGGEKKGAGAMGGGGGAEGNAVRGAVKGKKGKGGKGGKGEPAAPSAAEIKAREERELREKVARLKISREYKRYVVADNLRRVANREEPKAVPEYLQHVHEDPL